jgi:hypothetical protein
MNSGTPSPPRIVIGSAGSRPTAEPRAQGLGVDHRDVGGLWAGQHHALFCACHVAGFEGGRQPRRRLEADQAIEGAALYVSNVLANRINMMTIPSAANFKAEAVKIGDAKFWLIGRDTNDLQSSLQSDTPFWGLVDEAGK